MMAKPTFILLFVSSLFLLAWRTIAPKETPVCVRINLLGYTPSGLKIAVWGGAKSGQITTFSVINDDTKQVSFTKPVGTAFGAYGPFEQTYRLDFSALKLPGRYHIRVGQTESPSFVIGDSVYAGAADFCLRYMRQQRSGYNPSLRDSCHTHDGYTMYGPMPDSTHIDVVGGWHDASDYLQYSATSANTTYHLLAAYRDFPAAFGDAHLANGLPGTNRQPDVLDEARWGLDWLLKMHPTDTWLFNQLGDDRDHIRMRLPGQDSAYGKGVERPVYFCTGQPQGLMKYKNRATGVASTAGKFSSAFALGTTLFGGRDKAYAGKLSQRALSAYELGQQKPGVCQTAPGRAPYFYEEDNWVDDMELAAAELAKNGLIASKTRSSLLTEAIDYAAKEPQTPWFAADTARHYQWYPFVNLGHASLLTQVSSRQKAQIATYYRQGIEQVWQRARTNAFLRGVPFVWCSNNLTVAFALQCYWYRQSTGDTRYQPLEQACFDWLFGCNPWGSSFVYGLPAGADTPADPHSAFTHLGHIPIDGGLVDGPVFGSIYKNLIGITLYSGDEYAAYQSSLVVYHDDYGDYSTNEPTMDGTASLVYLLAAKETEANRRNVKKKP